MCWCIRNPVHFDSRVHAAVKSPYFGGQHGQESEEGEEGEDCEERSEEDCEEDPQGRQEEEVSSPIEIAGGLTPATSSGLPAICLMGKLQKLRVRSTKEGVGETSGQAAGSNFLSWIFGPAEETVFFVRCGRWSAISSAGLIPQDWLA